MRATTTAIAVVALVALVFVALSAPQSVHARASLLRRHHHAPVHAALSTPSAPSVAAAQDADCQLRQFTLSSVATIEPASPTANWTALAHSALRLDTLCPTSTPTQSIFAPRLDSPRARPSPPILSLADSCDAEFYVATNGSDSDDGSLDSPFATLTHAFDATRAARALQHVVSPCIILRAGTYFLGESLPSSAGSPKDSQFGAIDLLPIDSGLTISAYPGESVTISGGARITPSWQIYAKTSAGTIYSTKLTPANPSSQLLTDSFHLTEMFVGGERAVRAKWPNGDPSTHGLFSNNTGYDSSSMSWMAPFPHGDAQEIHVAQPTIPNAFFGTYQTAVDGAASVYDPPHSFWAMANPPGGAGATFIVPSGMNTKNTDLAARAAKWSNPSTGYVHAFHGGAWANWVFSIESYDTSLNELHFSEGGFQDARGWSYGGPFYVEWLLEELDDGFEWFFDESSQTLYFMPNGTNTAPPTELIVSQLPCILSAHGTPDSPVADVTLSGLTFSHTASTMMRKFEVPSGGDWSVHRGGAVFLTGTANFAIQTSVFSYLGGTGVVVSNWNLGTSISYSEFVWGCDSGIIVLGSMPGVDEVSSTNQPDLVSITHNLFHELGIYIKQSAPVLISLSRSITVSSNLIFNVPRAGVNINDPFYGNHTIEGNVMFNTVRETADHGPINSWDRLPVLLRGVNATTGESYHTMNPFVTHIWRNLLFNNYRSTWPIDHDDGSRVYDDAFNVLVYGGAKNYLGNSKWTHDSLFIYPDGQRFDTATEWLMKVQARRITPVRSNSIGDSVDQLGDSFWGIQCAQTYAPQANSSGWNERWFNNTCAMWTGNQPYRLENCKVGSMNDIVPYLANNRLYFVASGATAQIPCDLANGTSVNLSLADMQALGYDVGTVQGPAPSTAELIQQAMDILF